MRLGVWTTLILNGGLRLAFCSGQRLCGKWNGLGITMIHAMLLEPYGCIPFGILVHHFLTIIAWKTMLISTLCPIEKVPRRQKEKPVKRINCRYQVLGLPLSILNARKAKQQVRLVPP
jgi:hypothetical protein